MTELRSSSLHISLQYALHSAGYTVVQRASTASGQKFDTAVVPAGKLTIPNSSDSEISEYPWLLVFSGFSNNICSCKKLLRIQVFFSYLLLVYLQHCVLRLGIKYCFINCENLIRWKWNTSSISVAWEHLSVLTLDKNKSCSQLPINLKCSLVFTYRCNLGWREMHTL